jgi:hypothetical protein
MRGQPKMKLREFYDQALLSPELLCLNCGNTDWGMGISHCSDQKRQDCLLFVTDMVECLAKNNHNLAPKCKRSQAPLP